MLNKIIFLFILLIFAFSVSGEETVDIWKTDNNSENLVKEKKIEIKKEEDEENNSSLFETIKPAFSNIQEEEKIQSGEENIFGLFDPEENNLTIRMWLNSDGEKILKQLNRIDKLKLSKDSEEILFNILFTNSYLPKMNINDFNFLDYKSKWLIKNKKNSIIEKYLKKNPNLKNQSVLIEFLINESLAEANVEKACEKTKLTNSFYKSEYLDKFFIYCLVKKNKIDEAQLKFDLLKENGFKNNFYEKKINFLLGYTEKANLKISDKSLFEFHLSHTVNPNFKYEPNENTSNEIWRYLSSSNLFNSFETIDIENEKKINLIEKAVSESTYDSKELFNIYKRILFNINQFLDIENSYKTLPSFKARALLYQATLLSENYEKKIKLILKLNELFEKDNIEEAFLQETKLILSKIDRQEIPDKYLDFYDYHLNKGENNLEDQKKIKFNNSILHRSKLLKYFIDDKYKVKNLKKDIESVYKKVKKNKKYFFSTKDIILVESLKADGVKIPRKLEKLYSLKNLTIPENLINLYHQKEEGLFMLYIVEIVGEDKFSDLDEDTLYFIITLLNKFNLTKLRNNIIAKSFPETI